MWDIARAVLRGNFIALNVHTGKELSKITYLSSPLKNKTETQSRQKEENNTRKTSETENSKT